MASKNDDSMICPDCGGESKPIGEGWLGLMPEGESGRCIHCGIALVPSDDQKANEGSESGFLARFLIIALSLGLLLYLLNKNFGALDYINEYGHLAYSIIFLLVISSTLAYGKIFQKLKYISIWFGIFLVFLIGYSYRYDLLEIKNKVVAEVIPSRGVQTELDSISFPVSNDGHFYIRALVNGTPVVFLADTGATDIVLSPSDAEKLNYKLSGLIFNKVYQTANGYVRGSSIQLSNLKIGHIHFSQISASVNEAEMSHSLLGMAFFRQLARYEVKNEMLTLY